MGRGRGRGGGAHREEQAIGSGGMVPSPLGQLAPPTPQHAPGRMVAMKFCSVDLCSDLRPPRGLWARNASVSSAAATASSAQWCAPNTITRLNPIFHTSVVLSGRSKLKSQGSSSPGATSG